MSLLFHVLFIDKCSEAFCILGFPSVLSSTNALRCCRRWAVPPPVVLQVDKLCEGKVKVVHMLEETMQLIKVAVPHAKKIGVLSTTGTRSSQALPDSFALLCLSVHLVFYRVGGSQVYAQLLKAQGFDLVQVPESSSANALVLERAGQLWRPSP